MRVFAAAPIADATTMMMIATNTCGKNVTIAVRRSLIGLGPNAENASCRVNSITAK